ncbi:MAG: hypothetical protein OEU36_07585 [Gammaproteobacteria bacterium]|nr:hypothetical protein [Gammaproteobacteria bacterium]
MTKSTLRIEANSRSLIVTRRIGLSVTWMLVSFSAENVMAEFDFEVQTGLVRTDNLGRLRDSEVDDAIAGAGVSIRYEEIRPNADVELLANVSYLEYLDNSFEPETLEAVSAAIEYTVIPDLFTWSLDDTSGQQILDPLQAITPSNREATNILATGPDISVRFGQRWTTTLGGRYIDNYYEIRELDNERLVGLLSVQRELSINRAISLEINTQRVEFDDTSLNDDYDRDNLYLLFTSETGHTAIEVSLGRTELRGLETTESGPLFALDASRQIGAYSELTGAIGSGLTDGGEIFQFLGGGDLGATQDIVGVSDPLRNRYVVGGFSFLRQQTNIGVTARVSDEEFVTRSDLDRGLSNLLVYFSREFQSGWETRISASMGRRRFELSDRRDEDVAVRMAVSRRVGRQARLNFSYDYIQRDSSEVDVEYEENRIGFGFSYGTDVLNSSFID